MVDPGIHPTWATSATAVTNTPGSTIVLNMDVNVSPQEEPMAQVVAPAEPPTIHIDPYEGAKNLRQMLRQLRELTLQPSISSLFPENMKELLKLTTQTRASLEKVADCQTKINHVLPHLDEAIHTRRAAAGGEQMKYLRELFVEMSEEQDKAYSYARMAVDYAAWAVNHMPQAPNNQAATRLVRECRLIAQALPTTPMNATTPAEVVLQALITIMSNFGMVVPGEKLHKPAADPVAKEIAEAAIKFEDQYEMSKEEYIAKHGYDPSHNDDEEQEDGDD